MDECPVGCGRTVGAGKLMCAPCWGEVPRALQRAVNETWRAYRRVVQARPPASADARMSARAAYQEARATAIGSIS